jgi:hypothetical protein
MGRPRIEWTDTQLRQILAALPRLNRDTQQDNARFLDGVIAVVRAATGRLYGATTYSKLLRHVAPQAGIERSPSSSTVQAAVLRAQSFAAAQPGARLGAAEGAQWAGPTGGSRDGNGVTVTRAGKSAAKRARASANAGVTADTLQSALVPAIRDVLTPLLGQLQTASARGRAPARHDDALQLRLTEAALADAHARIRGLEQEAAHLRRELGRAEAARDLAGKHVNAMLEGLHNTITGSGGSAAMLTQAVKRLDGTGRFLKTQNEAMRRQATHEAAALREQNRKLSEHIDHLLLDNNHYRQVLAAQPGRRRAGA